MLSYTSPPTSLVRPRNTNPNQDRRVVASVKSGNRLPDLKLLPPLPRSVEKKKKQRHGRRGPGVYDRNWKRPRSL